MKKVLFIGIGAVFLAAPLASNAMMDGMHGDTAMGDMDGGHHGGAVCGDPAQALLSVADFNADGRVTGKDIAMLRKILKKTDDDEDEYGDDDSDDDRKVKKHKSYPYMALYDLNADHVVDKHDLDLAKQQKGMQSTEFDREIAAMYQRFQRLQFVDSEARLMQWGYNPIPVALKGHGVHWFNQAGMESMLGMSKPDINVAEGLNVESEDKKVHGLFWAYPADPVFDNGATDYPQPGGAWQDQRVIAFSNTPEKMTSSEHENWHAHAGLCMTVIHSNDANGNLVRTGYANQHLSFNECQALPNDEKQKMFDDQGNVVAEVNMWATFWMIHMWMLDPNPNGFFAGTHPCVEKNGLDEAAINGDREVPMFFKMMH